MVNTWLRDDTRTAVSRFGESLGHSGEAFDSAASNLATDLAATTSDPVLAATQAQAIFAKELGLQSMAIAFDDVFRLMAWMFLAALLMVPFAKRISNAPASAGPGH
jgi:MFS transporter, DHA2 family, multidrug resistance protein